MLATEKYFFDPYTQEAHDHYIEQHVPSYLTRQQECTAECDPELGGCITCTEHRMLSHLVGHEEFDDWIREVADELGMCVGCGGFHGSDDD